jgi:hypothetical protein
MHNIKKNKTVKMQLKKIPVQDIQWDPLSPNYLVVCWQNGSMSLIDADAEKEMQTFDRQGQGYS